MYANIIDLLQKKGMIKDINEQKAEDIFMEMTEDEMLPERWRIDVQTFIGDKFPDIAEKYTILKVEKHEGYNDLDKYLDEEILDNRSIDEITEDDKKLLKDQHEQKEKALDDEIKKNIDEAFRDTDKMREHLEGIKKRKEQEIKDIEDDLVRLQKGEKLKAQEEMEKAQAKKEEIRKQREEQREKLKK